MTSDKAVAVEQRVNQIVTDASPLWGPWQEDLGSLGVTGWTVRHARYRRAASGGIEFDFDALSTSSVSGFINAFPNAMQGFAIPARTQAFAVGIDTTLTSTSNNWPRIKLTTGGGVEVGLPPSGGSGTHANATFTYYLDA